MRAGRSPIQVDCQACGTLWASLGAGAAFTQPPVDLFARHEERCQGRAVIASMVRGVAGHPTRVMFDISAPGVVMGALQAAEGSP